MARSRLISKVCSLIENKAGSRQSSDLGYTRKLWDDPGYSLDRDVDATPPDVIFAAILVDDTLIFRTPSGLLAGKVDQGTGGREDGAFVHNGVLVQGGDGSVTLDVNLVHVETSLREVLDVFTEDCKQGKSERVCQSHDLDSAYV
jgi:hypothetical protein